MNHSNRSSLLSVSLQNHLLMGGFMFGTVFMATDPVSGPLHRKSQFIYGLGIGSLCILIRAINPAFPEGMMLSILFMNIFSPLIDHYITIFEINNRRSKRVQ
jgi:Na+-transporting NADH:ubiquinone oxidoreductase subunit B